MEWVQEWEITLICMILWLAITHQQIQSKQYDEHWYNDVHDEKNQSTELCKGLESVKPFLTLDKWFHETDTCRESLICSTIRHCSEIERQWYACSCFISGIYHNVVTWTWLQVTDHSCGSSTNKLAHFYSFVATFQKCLLFQKRRLMARLVLMTIWLQLAMVQVEMRDFVHLAVFPHQGGWMHAHCAPPKQQTWGCGSWTMR